MILKNSTILTAICKKYGMEFDPYYKYIIKHNVATTAVEYKHKFYALKYFDGCFYPFLVEKEGD